MKKVFEVEKPITNGEYWVYENADTRVPSSMYWDNDLNQFTSADNSPGPPHQVKDPVYWDENDHAKKPPIGLTPRKTHNWQRAQDIMAALTRYVAQSKPIPKEWLDELSDICGEK